LKKNIEQNINHNVATKAKSQLSGSDPASSSSEDSGK
jgi:hypothetical protein